jgi:hypothetical protein
MASIRPHVPAHLRARNAAEQQSAEAGPSIGHLVPPAAQMPVAAIVTPRYEEEEEDEDEDVYVPELPPDLAAARANPSAAAAAPPAPPRRRPIGPAARGPLRREEEEEESEEEEEIGPAPLPSGPSSHVHEDAVIEFMQKEAQRRQAIEVRCVVLIDVLHLPRLVPCCSFACFSAVQRGAMHLLACTCTRVVSLLYSPPPLLSSTGGGAPQDASA